VSDYKEIYEKITELLRNNRGSICINSTYGTGKSTLLDKIIKSTNVLLITSRITLAREFNKKFNIPLYLDGFSNKSKSFVCSIDSIHKISITKSYDLIVFDESESVLSHLTFLDKQNKLAKCYKNLNRLMKSASVNLFMDADISDRTISFIKETLGQVPTVYSNEYKHKSRKLTITNNIKELQYEMNKSLERNLNICLVSTSKTQALNFEAYFKEYNPYVIIAESSDKDKKEIADTSILKTNNVRLFIYSPSITCGVDISFKHFDRVYGIYTDGSVCARVYSQMLERVRKEYLTYKNILIYSDMKEHNFANSINDLKEDLKDHFNILSETRTFNLFEEANANRATHLKCFREIQERMGNTVEILDRKEVKFNIVDRKDKPNDIANAHEIDCETADSLELKQDNREDLTREEKNSLKKYHLLRKFSHIKERDEKIIRLMINNQYIKDKHDQFNFALSHKKIDVHPSDSINYVIETKKVNALVQTLSLMGINKVNDVIKNDISFQPAMDLLNNNIHLWPESKKVLKSNYMLQSFNNKLVGYGFELKCKSGAKNKTKSIKLQLNSLHSKLIKSQ
jgi:hypothetical protein